MDDQDVDLRRALELSLMDMNESPSSSSPKQTSPGDSSKAKRHRKITGTYVLPEDERRRLFVQVFGPEPLAEDLKRWEDSYFTFSDEAKFGLWQRQGGPCGVLVPLQGLLLRVLLFPRDGDGEALAAPPNNVSDERRWGALFIALSQTLARVTQDNVYSVVSADKEEVKVYSFGSYAEILQFYEGAGRAALSQPRSLLHFIYSLLLTRSPETIRNDMDDDAQPLIGRFGHCSQELVNLMLFGEATSNVFDGTQDIGGGMRLKGVTKTEVDIGYLSEVEAMRYVTVGERYKFSKFPIWVVGSQTHYTLLFSGDLAVCNASNNSEERRVREIFNRHCLDPEAGMCDISKLTALLNEIQCDHKAEIKERILAITSDIFVWSDLWSLLEPRETSKMQKFTMYLYDGQDPPGPRLRHFVLETCDVDAGVGQGDTDAFCGALRTRWPSCLISGTSERVRKNV